MGLLSYHVGYWWCLVVSIAAGFVVGGLTERVLVRRLYGKPEINPIVVMVGLLVVLESVMGAIWGTTPRPLPTPFSFYDYLLKGHPVALSPNAVFQLVAAAIVTLSIALLFRLTNSGSSSVRSRLLQRCRASSACASGGCSRGDGSSRRASGPWPR